jgi:hypothetical protein
MTLVALLLAVLVLVALLTAAAAFASFVFRLGTSLPQRADKLGDRIDAIHAIAELRGQIEDVDDGEAAGVG